MGGKRRNLSIAGTCMFKKIFFLLFFFTFFFEAFPQDTASARKILRTLCSPRFHGRGYYKNGVHKAARFLMKEMRKMHLKPLFGQFNFMNFTHPVVVFPKDPTLIINNKKLIPGKEFIVSPSSGSLHWDTILPGPLSWTAFNQYKKNFFVPEKKLTWSVSVRMEKEKTSFHILNGSCDTIIRSCRAVIKSKQEENFLEYILGGYVPGKTSDSMVVFCAHYDHLGRMGPSSLFPGANDNASGTTMVLQLAQYYSRNPGKYTMVFIFFPAEEAGLLGSQYFCENPPVDLKKIKFLINLDLLGTGEDGIMTVNGSVYPEFFQLLENINQEKKYVKEIRKRGPAANSDHYWFYKKGVPCFFIYTLGGVSYYHDIYDRWETLPLTRYEEIFRLLADFVERL